MTARKIVLAGGSGFLGRLLVRAFEESGDQVVVLSRHPAPEITPRTVGWDHAAEEIDGAHVVINLAGRSVNCRYTAENRREILESRISSVRAISSAIERAINPPRVWLQMSTATIYADRYEGANDEATGVIGGPWKFSVDVAEAWEKAVDAIALPRTRVIKLRTAMVMGTGSGGPFDLLLRLVRFGLGGHAGDGRQYVSWIHERDFVRAVIWLIERGDVSGVVNLAAPNPLPNRDFMRLLREAWGIRFGLPAPQWLLTPAAVVVGTETELLLKSRRVVPGRLVERGFTFVFPQWKEAARDLCARWKEGGHEKNLRSVRLAVRSLLTRPDVDAGAAGAHRY